MQTSFPYGSAFLLLRTDAKLISWSRSFFPLRCKSLKKTAAEAASTSALGKGWREHAAASGFLDHYTAASDNVHAIWTYRNKTVSYGNNLDKQERINFCIFFFTNTLFYSLEDLSLLCGIISVPNEGRQLRIIEMMALFLNGKLEYLHFRNSMQPFCIQNSWSRPHHGSIWIDLWSFV